MDFREAFEASARSFVEVTVAGGGAYYLSLVSTQLVAFALNAPASTRRGNVISLCGIATASVASVLATNEFAHRGLNIFTSSKNDLELATALGSCVAMGFFSFSILGGRLRSVLPSHYCYIGGFAQKRPAMRTLGEKYADQAERGKINLLGTMDGCHTCGARDRPKYIADHQPPNALAKRMNAKWYRRAFGRKVPQYFYAQCEPCSLVQSVEVNRYLTRTFAQNLVQRGHLKLHLRELRPFHLAGVLTSWWWVWSWSLLLT